MKHVVRTVVFLCLLVAGWGTVPGQGPVEFVRVGAYGSGPYLDVAKSGHYVFCAACSGGVDVIDVQNPAQPLLVGRIAESRATGVFSLDNRLYVTGSGLGIWDISNPLAPVQLGRYDGGILNYGGFDLFVADPIACLVDFTGLHLIQVSDPQAPEPVGFYPLSGANDVYVVGSMAFVCSFMEGLHIVDLEDPANPQTVGIWPSDGVDNADGVWADGARAFLLNQASGTTRMDIIDVSVPSNPSLLGTYVVASGYLDFVSVIGNLAYLTDFFQFQIVDVTDPANPQLNGAVNPSPLGGGMSHVLAPPWAYQSNFVDGLAVIDISDSANPVLTGTYDHSANLQAVDYWEHYVLVGGYNEVTVFDVADPASPTPVSSVILTDTLSDMDNVRSIKIVDGFLAYVACGWLGVRVIDLVNPAAPVMWPGFNTPGTAIHLDVADSILYVADYYTLQILDCADPFNLLPIGQYDYACDPIRVHIDGHYAYLADRSAALGGLQILDVADPTAPVFVGAYDIPESAPNGVYAFGPFAYLASGGNRVYVLDTADPQAPQLLGTVDLPAATRNLDAFGDFIFLSDTAGFHAVDVSNHQDPILAAAFELEPVSALVGHDTFIFAVGGDTGRLVSLEVVVPEQGVRMDYNVDQTGQVYPDSPSQVAPATSLTFLVEPLAFLGSAYGDPVVIALTLPDSVALSQTLADGTLDTAAPFPAAGEIVPGLAVTEYQIDKVTGRAVPAPGAKSLGDVAPWAVQILRYVAGEHVIWLRLNQSTFRWTPAEPGNLLGFTIGLAGGVWPTTADSNWGATGMFSQASTLFYLDMRAYDFEANDNLLAVDISSFYQFDGDPTDTPVTPDRVDLFRLESVIEEPAPVVSQVGATVTDLAVADMDGDGREDIITIDGTTDRLYVAYGQPDGTFLNLQWWHLEGIDPLKVDAGDVSGDGRPDVLIGTADGQLAIYLWETLFSDKTAGRDCLRQPPLRRLQGAPSDTLLQDITGDGLSDYLYTVAAADHLQVLLGNTFNPGGSYPTGAEPVAMVGGDFNADQAPDVAVANRTGNSVTVYLNDGSGNFAGSEVTGLGGGPLDVDAADVNRDGRDDLAVALVTDKALAVMTADADGHFQSDQAQRIYFTQQPSAVLADNFDGLNGADALLGFSDFNKLSLCLSDASGTMSFAYNIDALGDVVVGPGQSVTLSSDSILSVAGGTGLGGISSRQGVAGISQRSVGVIHFPRSHEISFSVVNLGETEALMNLELYDDAGGFRTATTVSLPANIQFARYFADLLGPEAAQAGRWVRAFLTASDTYGLWLVNDPAVTFLDGTRAADMRTTASDFILPELATGDGSTTGLVLTNPNKYAVNATLTLIGADGIAKGSLNRRLAGRSSLSQEATALFPSMGGGDYIRVRADAGLHGVELFGDADALACLAGLLPGECQPRQYLPHYASGAFGAAVYSSKLKLVNPADQAVTVRISRCDDSGAVVTQTPDMPLPAGGLFETDVATLFGLSEPATGYLIVDTLEPSGVVGNVTFGDAADGRFLSSLPLQGTGHRHYVLGHIANGTLDTIGFFTGLAVLNIGATQQTVELTAVGQDGLPRATAQMLLSPGQRGITLLSAVMPDLGSLFGGYLLVEGGDDAQLVVFQLFGDDSLNFLSAVPAVPLDD